MRRNNKKPMPTSDRLAGIIGEAKISGGSSEGLEARQKAAEKGNARRSSRQGRRSTGRRRRRS